LGLDVGGGEWAGAPAEAADGATVKTREEATLRVVAEVLVIAVGWRRWGGV
jgi:hypothetical protein